MCYLEQYSTTMDFSQNQKKQSRDFTKYASLIKTIHSLPLNTCKGLVWLFRILYLSRGFDIWSIYAQTTEEYVKGVEQIINSHQFSKDQLLDIEFKRAESFEIIYQYDNYQKVLNITKN